MEIEFYTTTSAEGVVLRHWWVCRRRDFAAAVGAARAAVNAGRPAERVRLVVSPPMCRPRDLILGADALVAYAEGGAAPMGELR